MTRAVIGPASETAHPVGSIVAGRFQIEAELARGGMGCVYRARDVSTGEAVALKRLQGGEGVNPALLGLFEREYRTLRSLKHPRIIQVHEYGVDRGGAYYTMELLSGADVGRLAPQPYQQACSYLRDVASSLALLHARRLLHRDVSPYNVRATEGGRCKLIDFGALTGFGVARNIVGTPPCIAPEAVRGAPLDQRADLYALGATAYYMLTRRHAYPAKSIADLSRVWQSAVPKPSQYAPGLPPALDALVLSLIHQDPLARPESAAEVIERLNVIAGLPADDEPQAAASYFWSTALVAREAQLEQIHGVLRGAVAGHGAALLLQGLSGVGRSRLLSETCVQAQLAGATAIEVDAAREQRENGTALMLAAKLFDAAPEAALEAAAPYAPVLATLLPELADKLQVRERATIPETPGEWRGRVQAALAAWFSRVSEATALLLSVDNLEAADDASIALLAALAADAGSRKLLVLAAVRSERAEQAGSGLRLLRELASTIELEALSAEQTMALARAMFGDVPNTMGLGEWMYRASGGLPSHCFELASELRRRGIVRYAGGTWVLPQDAAGMRGLPSGIAEALEQRIARLSPAGAELAAALCVHPTPLSIELCRAVAQALDLSDVFARLDDLVDNDVLASSGDSFRFRHDSLRELVLQRLDPESRQLRYRVMGNALLATAASDDRIARVEAGWHLLRGGEELRGAQLLQRTAMEFEIGTGSLQAAIPALEEARKVYRKHNRSLYELLPIVSRLATEGYYSDRRLSLAYADEAFALLRKATGLDLASKLQPFLGRKLSVYTGLGYAALRFYCTPRARRMPSFTEIFVLLVNCVTTQAGAGTVCLDTEAVQRAADFIEPLTVLGPRHITSAIHDYCLCLMRMGLECQSEARAGWLSLLERLSDTEQFKALPEYVRQLYRGGALFALGLVESWCDGDDALVRARELEALGLRIYDRAAHQIRLLYHAGRGEMEQAERCRKRMELHAVQTGSAWQVEVTVPLTLSVVYLALGDVVRIKRISEQIEQLAVANTSLVRTARASRAAYLLLRGSAEEAVAEYQAVFDSAPVRGFIGWARSVGFQAQAYNQLGRYAEALAACEAAMLHVRPEDRRFVRMFLMLEVQHALALAGLGRTLDAARKLQKLITEHEPLRGPLTLGLLHEARARVALLHRDKDTFARDLAEVERWYRPTCVPSLIARTEFLARQGEEVFDLPRTYGSASIAPSSLSTARSALSQCSDDRARAELALDLILEEGGVVQGHLFLVGAEDELVLVASRSPAPPTRGLRLEAAELLVRFREDAGATRLETHGAVPTVVRRTNADGEFRTHLLWCVIDGEPALVGVVAMRASPDERNVGFHFLQTLADGLVTQSDAH